MPVRRGRKSRAESRYAEQAVRLAGHLRELRQSAGLTQERLSIQAGVGIATVRKLETGKIVEPGYFTVLAVMRVLGTTPAELGD